MICDSYIVDVRSNRSCQAPVHSLNVLTAGSTVKSRLDSTSKCVYSTWYTGSRLDSTRKCVYSTWYISSRLDNAYTVHGIPAPDWTMRIQYMVYRLQTGQCVYNTWYTGSRLDSKRKCVYSTWYIGSRLDSTRKCVYSTWYTGLAGTMQNFEYRILKKDFKNWKHKSQLRPTRNLSKCFSP